MSRSPHDRSTDERTIAAILLAWHRPEARHFAFRDTRDAWAVLVSEVMLQQTQAPRVERHWIAFMARFPTPASLAEASAGDAVRAWQGLGYNRRAVRLWEAAVAIVERHGGQVPDELVDLERLPGIGPYTARAVAAIAFGRPVAPLDTNIRRVIARVLHGRGRAGDPGASVLPAQLQVDADGLLGAVDPRAWTLAAMDVGATICRPRAPRCTACPLLEVCRYAATATEAAATPPPGRQHAPFETTSRWLRGRLVDTLREAAPGSWTRVAGSVGTHSADAVAAALAGLRRDGLVELDGDGRARLPV